MSSLKYEYILMTKHLFGCLPKLSNFDPMKSKGTRTMFHGQLPILTLVCLFFLHHSILTLAGNFPTPKSSSDNGDNYCLKNNLPNSHSKLHKFMLAFGHGNTIATIVIIIITLLNIIVYKLRQLQEANVGHNSNPPQLLPWEQICRHFTYSDIVSATHNFDDALVIGKGGFGKVYKGIIDNGAVTVAMKRLNPMSSQGPPEFWAEIEMLSKFRHSHLVSLIGYCNNSSEMILVYDYMPNGTFADHLHKNGRKGGNNSKLSWVQRLKICIGAARGLDYLHTGTGVKHRVIHRDVKSSNILLDENWAAKISDFGLSKIGPADQSCTHVITNVKGTFGYLDPEYFMTRRLTRKSDVYAFGVVLFEALSGRPALDLRLDADQRGLATWAPNCVKEGTLHQIIDISLKDQIFPDSLAQFAQTANQCLHNRPDKRPTMAEVVASLELALELQERTDSSMLDGMIFNTGGACDSKDSIQFSMFMEHQELSNSSNGEHLDRQIDGTVQSSDANNVQPGVKPNKTTAFKKMAWLPFFGTTRVTSVHSDAKPSKNSKSNNDNGNNIFPNKDGDLVQIVTPHLKFFTFAELRTATGNFNTNMVLGEGYFAKNFIGWVDEKTYAPSKVGVGMAIAVKRFDLKDFLGYISWQSEMELLGKLRHPNLISVLGYCLKNKELFLVYEYMQTRSLEWHLFNRDAKPLPWATRIRIAIGVARGLSFLCQTEKQIIYRQFKSCNILLDGDYNAKLLNYEDTKLGRVSCYTYVDSYIPTSIAGDLENHAYIAPECMAYGHVTEKSDVYGFGVLFLEIITGQRATDAIRPSVNKVSVSLARTYVEVDPALEGDYPPEGATQSSRIIENCLDFSPKNRPTMEEVVETLEHIHANAIKR